MTMTMEMPEVMSKVIHDFIRPVECFETTEEKDDEDQGTKTTTKLFKDEEEADSHYADLIDKLEDDYEVIKITFKQYKFINGKKEIKTEDYMYEDSCSCCQDRILVTYDVCSHPCDTYAEKCGVCQEYCCPNCREWCQDAGEYKCSCCDEEEEEDY